MDGECGGGFESFEVFLEKYPIQYQTERNVYQDYYPSGLLSDLIIKIRDRSFRVHKIVLASASEFFSDLLTETEDNDIINLNDIDPGTFDNLMRFIYGHVLEPIEILSMLNLADCLNIHHYEKIISSLKISNKIEYIEIVSRLYPEEVPDKIITHIHLNLGTESYLIPQRWNQQLKTLRQILI